jgi:hypothetical protein
VQIRGARGCQIRGAWNALAVTVDRHAWRRVALVLCATGWGANHFASLLAVYRARLGLDAAAPAALLGMYALGLVPGLLVAGPLSDRRGRRALVLPAATIALGASAVLGGLGDSFPALLVGRLAYGLGAGGVMSAGAAWLIELSMAGGATADAAARRATIALSAGFGGGPLVSGLLAQYAAWPTVVPYALHVAVLGVALAVAAAAPDPGTRRATGPLIRIELDRAGWRRFARGIAPMAPLVFGFPTIAFAALPSMLGGALGGAPIAYTGLVCAVTLATGVAAQPITRRFAPEAAARLGLAIGAVGLGLGAAVVAARAPAGLLVVAPVLGAAYGVCMTAGLQGVQRLAKPDARGGITGLYYVMTYVGFAAPYLLALAARLVAPEVALGVTAAGVVAIAATLPRRDPRGAITPGTGRGG